MSATYDRVYNPNTGGVVHMVHAFGQLVTRLKPVHLRRVAYVVLTITLVDTVINLMTGYSPAWVVGYVIDYLFKGYTGQL